MSIAILSATPALASAAWGTYETPAELYGLEDSEIAILHTAKTPDGKMYASWLQWSEQPGWGFDLHLQLFDEEGNPMWDEDTLAVETHRNTSWTADYWLVVAPNGDAIVSWADARSEENVEGDVYGHEPVIYRISQDQEYVWGDEGLTFGPEYKFPPTLYMFDGDLYAVLMSSEEYGPSKITRIDDEGNLEFEPIEFHTQLIPSEGSDFIAIYGDSEGTVCMRYDRDLKPVWEKPAVISEYMYTGYARNPYNTKSDGEGGFAITFARALNFTHLPIVQHISGDGEATFGPSLDVVPEEQMTGDLDYPVVGINPSTETILCAYDSYGGGEAAVGAQLVDYFGESLWGELGKDLAYKESLSGYAYGPIAIEALSDDQWFVVYADETGWSANILHFACYNNNGEVVWDYTNNTKTDVSRPNFSFENGKFTLTYICEETDDDWNTTYFIKNIVFDTNNPSGVAVKSMSTGDKTYYSIDGTRLSAPAKGINIVRNADGSASKVMIK